MGESPVFSILGILPYRHSTGERTNTGEDPFDEVICMSLLTLNQKIKTLSRHPCVVILVHKTTTL